MIEKKSGRLVPFAFPTVNGARWDAWVRGFEAFLDRTKPEDETELEEAEPDC